MDNGEDIGKTDRYLTVQIDIQEYNEEERGRTRVLGVQVAHLNYMGVGMDTGMYGHVRTGMYGICERE